MHINTEVNMTLEVCPLGTDATTFCQCLGIYLDRRTLVHNLYTSLQCGEHLGQAVSNLFSYLNARVDIKH